MASVAELGILLKARDQASGVMNDVKNLALGMAAAFVSTAALAVKAAEEEEVHMTKLKQAVEGTKDGWNVASGAIEDFLGSQRAVSGFSRGELADALALIAAQTSSYAEAQERLHYAEDIARGTNLDLYAASKLVGKVTEENVSVFARMGIVVKKGTTETELFALIQQKFGGQSAAYAATAEGQWAIFQDTIHQVLAVVGAKLLPLLTQGMQIVLGFVNSFTEGGQLEAVGKSFQTITTIAGEFFGVITGSAPDAGAALKGAIGPDAANTVMQAVALIRDVVRAVIGGDVPAIFKTLETRVPAILQAIGKFIGDAIPKVAAMLLGWAKEFIAWVGPLIPPMLNELLKLASQVIVWIGDHAEEIGKTFTSWVVSAIKILAEHLPGILLAIGTWVITEAVPGVLRIFGEVGKGIVSGILDGLGELKTAVWNALVAAFSNIDFWVGPFHVTSSGVTISVPNPFAGWGSSGGTGPPPGGEGPIIGAAGGFEGIVNSPTMFVVAENGPERVSVGQPGSGGGGIHLHFNAPVYGMTDFEDKVKAILRDGRLAGGFRGV